MQLIKVCGDVEKNVAEDVLNGHFQRACMQLLISDLADKDGSLLIGTARLLQLFNERRNELIRRASAITLKIYAPELQPEAQTTGAADVSNCAPLRSATTA